jgi:tetratricopeptide (TPR) repeat protein
MKTLLFSLSAAVVGFGAALMFVHRSNSDPVVAPETTAATIAPKPAVRAVSSESTSATPAGATAPEPSVRETAAPDQATVALATAIDSLTSPQTSFTEKQALWNQLRITGRLGEVTPSLEKLAAENPQDPQLRNALGEVQLQRLRAIMETGGDASEVPILAMQADRCFNQALSLEPTNWEAQFMKAASMAHWPAGLNKSSEVIQRLSNLTAQQDTLPSQPEFAQTYVILAQQYKAAGQRDQAAETLRLGATKFPGNSSLVQALADASKP